MISAGEFRNGVTFELDGNVVQVIEFQHVKPGKGAAFVRTKFKNVITGAVVERSEFTSQYLSPPIILSLSMQEAQLLNENLAQERTRREAIR